jgi:ABC-type nitrate/sulfonate/bicarbonate transport system ATPase subunit
LPRGEFVCLIGHSGCGKSTILSIIAGLAEASLGGAILDGREVREPGPDRGVVFQSPSLLPWLTAFENVMLGVSQVAGHLSRSGARSSSSTTCAWWAWTMPCTTGPRSCRRA